MTEILMMSAMFATQVNFIRVMNGMDKLEFQTSKPFIEYAEKCDPVRSDGKWIIMSSAASSCGPNSARDRADMIYALDEQYPFMKSPLYDRNRKGKLYAVVNKCNDKFFIVIEND